MNKLFSFFLLFSIAFCSNAQLGGQNSYGFLNLNTSARISALGGNQIAVKDNDPFLAFDNPSLLNEEMDNKLAMTYVSYLADIGVGFASYTKSFDSIGTFNLGVKYIDYGDFTETDNGGNEIGSFSAGEYAFVLGYSRPLDTNFSIGANVKTIYSSFYDASSLGLAADLGVTYFSEQNGITVALLAKNMGSQISSYTESSEDNPLPFEVQLGFSKKLSNVPVRIGIIAQHLQQWDLRYDNPNENTQSSILSDDDEEDDKREYAFLENLGRHLIGNLEFLVSENFNVRIGYNYLRRRELRVDEKLGTVGFSWGIGMRVSKFHISYGRSAFHQAGATNTFSVSTRLSDFVN